MVRPKRPTARPPRKPGNVHPRVPCLPLLRTEAMSRRALELAGFLWWHRNRPPGY